MEDRKPEHQGRFQVLALDGGGIRGIYSAAMLASFEADYSTRIAKHFDLIVGTSTGGLIALGLGLGLTPREILAFYLGDARHVLGNFLGWRDLAHVFVSKFSQPRLRRALSSTRLGGRRLGDSAKRLVIPSYDLGQDAVYLFKTPHHERFRRDWRVPAVDVALATSAAPTYFRAFRGIQRSRLIDGGVWANDPVLIGLTEAVSVLNHDLRHVRILSIGTTNPVVSRPRHLDWSGRLAWARHAPDVLLAAQSAGAQSIAGLLLGSEQLLRVNSVVPAKLLTLDTYRPDELLARAAHESRHVAPSIYRDFFGHVATPYTPAVDIQD